MIRVNQFHQRHPCIYSIFANFAPDEQNRGITYIGLQA